MTIEFDLAETETSISLTVEGVQIMSDVGASDSGDGDVTIFAQRTSTDDGDGNITL